MRAERTIRTTTTHYVTVELTTAEALNLRDIINRFTQHRDGAALEELGNALHEALATSPPPPESAP